MAALLKPVPSSKLKASSVTRKMIRGTSLMPKSNLEQLSIPASKAKTHLLELLDNVDRRREVVTITKRGRPVARLIPIENIPRQSIFGCMKGTIKITGDIVGPELDLWEAMS